MLDALSLFAILAPHKIRAFNDFAGQMKEHFHFASLLVEMTLLRLIYSTNVANVSTLRFEGFLTE